MITPASIPRAVGVRNFIKGRWRSGYRFLTDWPGELSATLEDLGLALMQDTDDDLGLFVTPVEGLGQVGTLLARVFLESDGRRGTWQHSVWLADPLLTVDDSFFGRVFESVYGSDPLGALESVYPRLAALEFREGEELVRGLFLPDVASGLDCDVSDPMIRDVQGALTRRAGVLPPVGVRVQVRSAGAGRRPAGPPTDPRGKVLHLPPAARPASSAPRSGRVFDPPSLMVPRTPRGESLPRPDAVGPAQEAAAALSPAPQGLVPESPVGAGPQAERAPDELVPDELAPVERAPDELVQDQLVPDELVQDELVQDDWTVECAAPRPATGLSLRAALDAGLASPEPASGPAGRARPAANPEQTGLVTLIRESADTTLTPRVGGAEPPPVWRLRLEPGATSAAEEEPPARASEAPAGGLAQVERPGPQAPGVRVPVRRRPQGVLQRTLRALGSSGGLLALVLLCLLALVAIWISLPSPPVEERPAALGVGAPAPPDPGQPGGEPGEVPRTDQEGAVSPALEDGEFQDGEFQDGEFQDGTLQVGTGPPPSSPPPSSPPPKGGASDAASGAPRPSARVEATPPAPVWPPAEPAPPASPEAGAARRLTRPAPAAPEDVAMLNHTRKAQSHGVPVGLEFEVVGGHCDSIKVFLSQAGQRLKVTWIEGSGPRYRTDAYPTQDLASASFTYNLDGAQVLSVWSACCVGSRNSCEHGYADNVDVTLR